MTDLALATTEATDVAAIRTDIVSGIYFGITEPADGAAINLRNPYVVINATEAKDTASMAASIYANLSISAVEAADGISMPIIVLWTSANDPNDPSIWVPVNDGMPYYETVN